MKKEIKDRLNNEEKEIIEQLEKEGSTYLYRFDRSVEYDKETGEVEYNREGLYFKRYKNVDDFVKREILGEEVKEYEESICVGERNEQGEIEYNQNWDPDTMEIEEDDGGMVFCKYIKGE